MSELTSSRLDGSSDIVTKHCNDNNLFFCGGGGGGWGSWELFVGGSFDPLKTLDRTLPA